MTNQTNEQALEAAIEKCLTGYSLEELKEQEVQDSVVLEREPLMSGSNKL